MGGQQSTLEDEVDSADLDRREPMIFLSEDLLRHIQAGNTQKLSSTDVEDDYPIGTMSARGFFEPDSVKSVETPVMSPTADVEKRAADLLERFLINVTPERVCGDEEDVARRCVGGRGSESLVLCKEEVATFLRCSRENLFARLGRE